MEKAPPELEQIGQGTRQIAQIVFGQVADAMESAQRPWAQADYSVKLNEGITGYIHSLWVTHRDGAKTQLPPPNELAPLVNVLFGLSGKLEKPFIGFSVSLTADGKCTTGFLYP